MDFLCVKNQVFEEYLLVHLSIIIEIIYIIYKICNIALYIFALHHKS